VCTKKKFEHTVKTFAALWCQLLLPYVIFEVQYNSLFHFSKECVCKSLSIDNMLLTKEMVFTKIIFVL